MNRRFLFLISLLTVIALLLGACGGGATPAPAAAPAAEEPAAEAPAASGDAVALQYWLWDSAQLPAYQKCADDFMAKNPTIKVELTQRGWDDYWSGI